MKNLNFNNKTNDVVNYLKWDVESPKANVVISHGMAEHPERYDDLAKFLNKKGYAVYAIYQIGHGKFAKIKGHMDKGDFDKCVSNLSELVDLAKKDHDVPTFLLGHSMGSFISQLYIERNHNIKALILSGSSAATPIMKVGAFVAKLVCAFNKDITTPSPMMDNMSFGAYNKPYKEVKTKFDWLNRDEKAVQKYIDDPLCGYVCSKSFFREMCGGLATMGDPKELAKIDKDLPIFIHGGSMDPVSECGKGLQALYEQYKNLGCKDVTLKIYDEARHEIYNELCKEEVYENTVNFIEKNL